MPIEKSELIKVGGQAVIEGVMMRSPKSLAISVRRAGGEIVVVERPWESLWERYKILRWPFLRGTVVLVESLINGMQALSFSVDQAAIGMENEEAKQNGKPAPESEKGMPRWAMAGMIVFSLGLAFTIFKGVPHLLTTLLGLSTDSVMFHVTDGVIKILMFIAYVWGISFMPDIRRVFQYHGAEHKSIYAYENGKDLTVENARQYTTLHPRCGTSFILIVLLSSILLFMAIFPFMPKFHENTWVNALIQIAIKLPLMFPVAGISYEFLRWSAKHTDNFLVRMLVAPGLWMQKITTREPDDQQLEVALTAMRKALWRERAGADAPVMDRDKLEIFASYADVTY